MEYYRGTLRANAAWGTERRWVPAWDFDFGSPSPDSATVIGRKRFHIWRMDWDEASIRLLLDDVLWNTVDLKKTLNRNKTGRNPFRQPHYLILTLAIGGKHGGDPSKGQFPARFEVDYVRVYQ